MTAADVLALRGALLESFDLLAKLTETIERIEAM
jgi:hypothetical protein